MQQLAREFRECQVHPFSLKTMQNVPFVINDSGLAIQQTNREMRMYVLQTDDPCNLKMQECQC